MLAHIIYIHTETALALVNDESTYLEDSSYLLIFVVEVLKSDEVAEKTIEVTEDVKELVHHLYVVRLLLKSSVLCYNLEKLSLLVLFDESLYCLKSE